jgi:hypothetical protein
MSATTINFTPRGLREFLLCDVKLQGILIWLATQWPPAELLIGDIHRDAAEEAAAGGVSGIHMTGPPYRAIDVRVTNLPGDPQVAADAIGALVNRKYVYDHARPDKLVAFTQRHGTGPHVHLQVHQATDFRDRLLSSSFMEDKV